MRFRLDHPTYPALAFYLLDPTPEAEAQVERLGPSKALAAAYDWPQHEYDYHNWADELNRLLWPSGGDYFASCLTLLDDDRAKILSALCAVERAALQGDVDGLCPGIVNSLAIAQAAVFETHSRAEALLACGADELAIALVRSGAGADEGYETIDPAVAAAINLAFTQTISAVQAAMDVAVTSLAPRPYVLLRAMMSPQEAARAPETYPAAGMTIEDVSATAETELIAWKLYPLPPVRLPEADETDVFRGMWLLPLVDLRYFWRLGPISSGRDDGYSSAGQGDRPTDSFPVSHVNPRETPDWMPPLRAYPDDTAPPDNYVPILDNGTHPAISPTDSRGWAANVQADMENWRVVCRDVRSNWNSADETPHTEFTGIVCDYPDDPEADNSYHLDAIALATAGNLIDGGATEVQQVQSLTPRKVRCLFRIANQSRTYEIAVYPGVSDPTTVDDLLTDDDGPDSTETPHLPKAVLGQLCPQEDPDDDTLDDIQTAAKQWTILYYLWRRNQYFLKFPGIAPVIPNGNAGVIIWDFAAGRFATTYLSSATLAGTGEAGFGGGDTAATDDAGTDDNTAFVLCTAETTVDGRYPVIRMRQIGLPETWEDMESAWGFNVIPAQGLKANELYLCHKNVDQFLGLNQWATRDCCAHGSDGSEPDGTGCWDGCCATDSDLRTIDIPITALSGDCPCLPMTVQVHCDSRHKHWYGHNSCTSEDGCTIEVFFLLQCIPCGDLSAAAPRDCPVDCSASPFYFCLNYYIRCTGTCSHTSTGHLSWSADEVDCATMALDGKTISVCGCDACVGDCSGDPCVACPTCIEGNPPAFGANVSRIIAVTWYLPDPQPDPGSSCCPTNLPQTFFLVWNGTNWTGAMSFTLVYPDATTADAFVTMRLGPQNGSTLCNSLTYGIYITPNNCPPGGLCGGGGPGWDTPISPPYPVLPAPQVYPMTGTEVSSCCPFTATHYIDASPGCDCQLMAFNFAGVA